MSSTGNQTHWVHWKQIPLRKKEIKKKECRQTYKEQKVPNA